MSQKTEIALGNGVIEVQGKGTIKEFVAKCISAVEDEIQATEAGGGSERIIALANGRFQTTVDQKHLYLFVVSEGMPQSYEDAPAKLRVSGQEINAIVVRIEEFELLLALEEHVGKYVAAAELVIDLTFILKKLKELLSERASDLERDDVVLKALGFRRPSISSSSSTVLSANASNLNEAQKSALIKCLGSDFVMVWGPPGTGKTHVLARVLAEEVLRGRSVALLSNTNIAVDQALEQLLKLCKTSKKLKRLKDEGRIIRLGTPQLESVSSITLEKVTERIAEELKKELTELKALRHNVDLELSEINSDLERLTYSLKSIRLIVQLLRRLNKNLEAKNFTAKELKRIRRRYQKLVKELLSLPQEFSALRIKSPLLQLLRELKRHRLKKTATENGSQYKNVCTELLDLSRNLSSYYNEMEKLLRQITILTNDLAPQKQWQSAISRLEKRQSQLRNLQDLQERLQIEIGKLDARIRELESLLEAIAARILKEALLVGCTCAKSTLEAGISGRKFSTVAVDESSMVSLPQALWCANLASNRFLCFGDFRQLPPITWLKPESNPESYMIMRGSIFEIHHLGERPNVIEDPRVCLLNEQYRMHPEICELVNNWMYGGRLRTVIATECESAQHPDNPLAMVDTSLFDAWCDKNEDFSWYNWHHALAVLELVRELNDTPSDDSGSNKKVLVLAPYRAQVRLIRALLESAGLLEAARVTTVWGSQGTEADVVIFDTVCAPPYTKPGRWFLDEPGSADGARLLNVAVTRAKNKLYVVGHNQHLMSHCPERAFARKILARLVTTAHVLDSQEITARLISNEPEDGGRFPICASETASLTLFDQNSFLEAFAGDLRQLPSGSRISVFRPFFSECSVAIWQELFHELLRNGCTLEIFTRNPSEQSKYKSSDAVALMIHELASSGAVVGPDSYLPGQKPEHHRFAFLEYPKESNLREEPILWIGSRKILRHHSASETMLRIQSRNVYSVFASIIGLDDLRKNTPVHILISKLENALQRQLGAVCPVHKQPMKLRFAAKSKYKFFFMSCPLWSKIGCNNKMSVSIESLNKALDSISAKCLEHDCDKPLGAEGRRLGVCIVCAERHYVPLLSYYRK